MRSKIYLGSTQIVLFLENTVKAREGLTLRAFCQYDLGSRLLLSDKIPSLSRFLFLLASVRQPYKGPAVGRYGDLKFQAFTAALPPAGDLSIIQSCMPALSRKIQRSGNTVQICCICFLSRKKKRGKLNFPMCKEEQA